MELPKNYDAKAVEARWLGAWETMNLFAWDPAKSREETFVVDTPPPTVSGSLHMGHLFSYSHQDFIVRYQRMRGKNIYFPIGWDDNGLPTERRVQNLLNVKCDAAQPYRAGFKAERGRKGDPTPISRKNFVELCDEVVVEDEKAFKHLWTRLGLSYDWSQEYATINVHARRLSQWSFLDLVERGHTYQDERPVMWDVDFQTAVAQAELVDKELPSAYHFLQFGVEGSGEKLEIATTRPELLPACVAVLVHPDDERYKAFAGRNAITPLFHVPVPIMADPKADPEKGTGVVMVCTFGDQTDVEWWQTYGLPLRQIVGRDGHLLPAHFVPAAEWSEARDDRHVARLEDGRDVVLSYGPGRTIPSLDPARANAVYAELQGAYVKKAQKRIVEIALEHGGLFAREPEAIVHAVKFFEKGDRPLEFIPTRQWYTRIIDKKDALIAQGRKIQWRPEFMIKRYEHWVEGLNADWCLSRQRFFGVPIPVWYRIDERGEVRHDQPLFPAKDRLPIDPLSDAPEGFAEAQRDQPGGFTGEADVLDTWATSSLTPQLASHWVLDPGRHARLFPMDMRPQSHEIIRTWAFYTIVKAYLHENEIPWRNVIISGWILDPDRKKMSKSQGNVVTPEPLIEEHGADAVRYWAARARLGADTAFDEQQFKVGRKLITKLFNASKFAIGRFAQVDAAALAPEAVVCEADRAMIAELRPLLDRIVRAYDQFDYAAAFQLAEDFFYQTFCDNYLELAKARTYDEGLTEGKRSACVTLRLVHRAILRLFAPFMPYIAEEIWSWVYGADPGMHASVHRSPWPLAAEFDAIPAPRYPESYAATCAVLEAVRRAKAEANLSMAAPVPMVHVTARPEVLEALRGVLDDLQRMLKIEAAELAEGPPAEGLAEVRTVVSPG